MAASLRSPSVHHRQCGHNDLQGPVGRVACFVGVLAAWVCFTQASCASPSGGRVWPEKFDFRIRFLGRISVCVDGFRQKAGPVRLIFILNATWS